MIKHILNLNGVEQLSRMQQSSILGGVDKCCIRKLPNGFDDGGWCNSSPECKAAGSRCAC